MSSLRLAATATISKIDVEGVTIAIRSWGDPYKPTVILVHGWPDSSKVWEPVVEILRHRFHVVTYDVRGTGESDKPKRIRDYHMSKLAEDFQAVCRHVCPTQKVHVVGHDWGSIQSWESVTDPRMKSRIASFTSISGPCLDHVGMWMRDNVSSMSLQRIGPVLSQVAHSWYIAAFQLPVLPAMAWHLGVDKLWPKLLKKTDGIDPTHYESHKQDAIHGVQMYRANMLPRLTKPRERYSEVPVQLLVPLDDIAVTPAMAETCLPWVKEVWRRDVKAGHWLSLNNPDFVAACVSEFIEFVQEGRETPSLAKARVRMPVAA